MNTINRVKVEKIIKQIENADSKKETKELHICIYQGTIKTIKKTEIIR
jgi:hypothetical protein